MSRPTKYALPAVSAQLSGDSASAAHPNLASVASAATRWHGRAAVLRALSSAIPSGSPSRLQA